MTTASKSEPVIVLPMLINGKAYEGAATLDVVNPATEQVIGRVPNASRDDLDMAVAAARAAFPAWKRTPLAERQKVIAAFAKAISDNTEELAALITAEQGKPLSESMMEVMGAVMWMQAASTMDLPVTVLEDNADHRVEQRHVPLGVVGAIVPWNVPVGLGHWKVAPALLAGNTMVLKPSPLTPLSTLRIAELVRDIVPAGVYNVVVGGDELGPWITSHPDIDKITFTGSSATGRKVMASASATLKRVTLELGGNDAAIVLPDVDIDAVVPDLFWAAFGNCGQVCIAAKRIFVHADIYDRFRDVFVAYAASVKVGNGAEAGVQMGPLQNAAQYGRVLKLINDCRTQGYTFLTGEAGPPEDQKGYFVPITIIDNPPDDSRIVAEEQFGPILPLLRYNDEEEVIRRANSTSLGLGGSVWSSDLDHAVAVGEQLDTGTVWINETIYLTPGQPFGGHKQSGIGVESGMDGLLEYTNIQVISVRKKPSSAHGNALTA